jgi:hypothetical protein
MTAPVVCSVSFDLLRFARPGDSRLAVLHRLSWPARAAALVNLSPHPQLFALDTPWSSGSFFVQGDAKRESITINRIYAQQPSIRFFGGFDVDRPRTLLCVQGNQSVSFHP